jgi:Protein of unknown function (DUF2752)
MAIESPSVTRMPGAARHDDRSPRFRAAAITLAGAVPLVGSAAVAWIPAVHERFLAAPVVCVSRLFFERDCAGCGLTRSFVALARGDFHSAVQWNPLGPVLYLYLCVMALSAVGEMVFPRFGLWRRLEGLATLAMLAWTAVDLVAFYLG